MATATLPNQALKDHVFVLFEAQHPGCPPPRMRGESANTPRLLPIGAAYEYIKAGYGSIDPRSKAAFETFMKNADAEIARRQQKSEMRNREREKACAGRPTDKARQEAAQFNRK